MASAEAFGSRPGAAPALSIPLLSENQVAGGQAPAADNSSSLSKKIEVHAPSIGGTSLAALGGEHGELSRWAHTISLIVNIALFVSKLWVWLSTFAMVVLASLIDSTVDLLAQVILLIMNRLSTMKGDESENMRYPAGRSRAEPVGVIACALLMAMASAMVIRDAAMVLIAFWQEGTVRSIAIGVVDQELLGGTILAKLLLYLWCARKAKETANVTVEALAQDHWNDVLSNLGALVAAALTQLDNSLWLADPIGAILISVYIIYSWVQTGMEQLDLILGRSADADFLDLVREMAETHDPAATLDLVRAYHFGPRFLVEVEIVMDASTPLRESHDVGIMLQHKIERLEQCDRCFVHVDYQTRDVDDHDPMTPLAYKTAEATNMPKPDFMLPKQQLAA